MKLLSHGPDDDTPSVKGCFWLGYAVFGSIAWAGIDVKTLKTKLIRLFWHSLFTETANIIQLRIFRNSSGLIAFILLSAKSLTFLVTIQSAEKLFAHSNCKPSSKSEKLSF